MPDDDPNFDPSSPNVDVNQTDVSNQTVGPAAHDVENAVPTGPQAGAPASKKWVVWTVAGIGALTLAGVIAATVKAIRSAGP